VTVEDQLAFALLGISVFLLLAGIVVGRYVAHAPGKVARLVFPSAALSGLLIYAVFTAVARGVIGGH
jgi:polyferredoxin